MDFWTIYLQGLLAVLILMTIVWIVSVFLKNASIVDPLWGMGFILAGLVYYFQAQGTGLRQDIVLTLLLIWGLRLSVFLAWRNFGKGEDFRYQKFRQDYGPQRYWWVSFFQVFLLQGVLLWMISAPLLAAQYFTESPSLNTLDYIAMALWLIGFIFEAGGDLQLAIFKSKEKNKGKLLDKGLWKYTRHPNYFGDAAIWWGFAFFSFAAGCYITAVSAILMSFLLVRVSGVMLLEKTLKNQKEGYQEYVRKTSAFIPWFPKK